MAAPREAWGIEIGAFAIKAIRLEREGDDVRVSDFAVIPHKKVLTTPDIDQDDIIRLSLGQFISQKSLEGEHLVMSVPGHAAFARFAKLPPVEPKKIPDIVKFEAVQQIPFPIDEVEWDYQTFASDDSPEIEVGIFAITRDRVKQRLGLYGDLGVSPEALTLSPVAIYNAMEFDQSLDKREGAVIFLDIGTQATDVVIADSGRCWIRTFPLGGTHFTEAIANAFKLSYSKAEKLKKEASTSKYAKQIMQAMRPVFSDLLQDLQRSIGYYQSLHPDHDLNDMIGIGSTFKIPGLRKFIGQQLQINVVRLDEYAKIAVTGREAASFAEHTVNMATAYGLALQGVGLADIDANLVPVRALREHMWHSKTKWFAGAAAVIIAGAATTLYHPITARSKLNPGGAPPEVAAMVNRGTSLKKQYEEAQAAAQVGVAARNMLQLADYRDVWPHLLGDASDALASTKPQPELLSADPEAAADIPADERRLVTLESLDGAYAFDPQAKTRRIAVTMDVELSHDEPIKFLTNSVAAWLRANAEREGVPYRILPGTVSCNPNLLDELRVDPEGVVSGGSRDSSRPSRPKRPGLSPPTAPRPGTPPGPGSGGVPPGPGADGGSSGGIGFGGGGNTRRRGGGGGATPPGPGSGGVPPGPGAGGSGGVGFGRDAGGGRPGLGGRERPGRDKPRERNLSLDADAPMPTRPAAHPPGSKFYRIPITFEIELIDPGRPATPPASAARPAPETEETQA